MPQEPAISAPSPTTTLSAPAYTPCVPGRDSHDTCGGTVCAWCGKRAAEPSMTLTESQVQALVTEGAYLAAQSAVVDTLLRLRSALETMPEAQAVVDALLLDSRED